MNFKDLVKKNFLSLDLFSVLLWEAINFYVPRIFLSLYLLFLAEGCCQSHDPLPQFCTLSHPQLCISKPRHLQAYPPLFRSPQLPSLVLLCFVFWEYFVQERSSWKHLVLSLKLWWPGLVSHWENLLEMKSSQRQGSRVAVASACLQKWHRWTCSQNRHRLTDFENNFG